MSASGGLIAFVLVVFQLVVTAVLVYLAWRFVEAAERIAVAHEKIARSKNPAKPPETP